MSRVRDTGNENPIVLSCRFGIRNEHWLTCVLILIMKYTSSSSFSVFITIMQVLQYLWTPSIYLYMLTSKQNLRQLVLVFFNFKVQK